MAIFSNDILFDDVENHIKQLAATTGREVITPALLAEQLLDMINYTYKCGDRLCSLIDQVDALEQKVTQLEFRIQSLTTMVRPSTGTTPDIVETLSDDDSQPIEDQQS